jgi:hypothetical protein
MNEINRSHTLPEITLTGEVMKKDSKIKFKMYSFYVLQLD